MKNIEHIAPELRDTKITEAKQQIINVSTRSGTNKEMEIFLQIIESNGKTTPKYLGSSVIQALCVYLDIRPSELMNENSIDEQVAQQIEERYFNKPPFLRWLKTKYLQLFKL